MDSVPGDHPQPSPLRPPMLMDDPFPPREKGAAQDMEADANAPCVGERLKMKYPARALAAMPDRPVKSVREGKSEPLRERRPAAGQAQAGGKWLDGANLARQPRR